MDEFTAHKMQVLSPLYLEAGLSLLDCQLLEGVLAVLLRHVYGLRAPYGVPGIEKLGDFLADVDRRTCGQLVAALRQHTDLSAAASDALADALVARNQLVHRVLIKNHRWILDADLRDGLIAEIGELRATVREGVDRLAPTMILLNETEYGILDADVQRELRDALGFVERD